MREVLVTGMGIISAIGNNPEEMLESLKSGVSTQAPVQGFETRLKNLPVCEVKSTNEDLKRIIAGMTGNFEYFDRLFSRTSLLGLIAAKQAMNASLSRIPAKRIGLVSATTVGGMDYNELHYNELSAEKVSPESFEILDCADSAQQIAKEFGIFYNVTTVSTACSSSANAIIIGARMIRNSFVDKVLVGGTDALTRFALNGFNSLEIVSPTGCKPFDADRNGVTLGEGAAYLVLESQETAVTESVLCRLSGFANTNEAYHQTASSPDGEGAALSIEKALQSAGLKPENIDYINAHGTGTVINDLSEGRAIQTIFGKMIPPVSSTKAFTGHTLAAAGAVEAVISILAIKNGLIFPNLGFAKEMPELSFLPETSLRRAEIRNVLSNSFGFGGSNASLIFSKVG